jgi:DUF4097 and DUF4098 domain-containing protein YvlB
MKRSLALMFITLAITLAAGSLVHAQDAAGDRVVVPARNSTRPRKVDVSVMHGSIAVKTYAGKEVIVETRNSSSRRDGSPATVDGLRRLDLPTRGLTVEEEDNVVTVRMHSNDSGEVVISVPADTSLKLHSMHGDIAVDGVHGEIDANNLNGKVTLNNVSGSVVAHSLNGTLKVSMDSVDQSKPLSFSTLNGSIDVTLPADFKGNVKLSADRGEIYSDFDFKLTGSPLVTQKNDTADGKFRVRVDRTMSGTINGGGTEATFKTYNGKIFIRKKK